MVPFDINKYLLMRAVSAQRPIEKGAHVPRKNDVRVLEYRPIHSMKFSAISGDQLKYNGSQGASGLD